MASGRCVPSAAPLDEFFVGYLRTPLRVARFAAITVCVLLLLADAVALTLYRAQAQRSSGDWGTVGEVSYDGVLVANPYPIVLVPAAGRVAAHAVLLVSDGKFGAPAGLAAFDGKTVTVTGYPLLRDGLVVLQLSEVTRGAKTSLVLAPPVPLGRRTLTGEIVDSKCYLGAMNPGEGKVHEGCAGLCLLGDIPALFVTRDAHGDLTYRLLADENGKAMPRRASSHAGQFLTLGGILTRLDGIELFSVPRASLD
jgi:uncharacterized membrane protein